MTYVDGFVLAIPKANIEAYRKVAIEAGKVWMEYGALSYMECMGDDVPPGEVTSFPMAVKAKDDEIVFFSWVTYASREKRDEVMKKVMDDPRFKDADMPFDGKRMIYGGFEGFVEY